VDPRIAQARQDLDEAFDDVLAFLRSLREEDWEAVDAAEGWPT
jgi:hypothetical protein